MDVSWPPKEYKKQLAIKTAGVEAYKIALHKLSTRPDSSNDDDDGATQGQEMCTVCDHQQHEPLETSTVVPEMSCVGVQLW